MTTPWETLSRYRAHDGTVASALQTRCEGDPGRPLLLFGNTTWSWGELVAQVEAAAHHLMRLGIGKGDRVAIVSDNSDAYVLLFLALARVGAILVPVNPRFTVLEASYVLDHAEVNAVAVTPETRVLAQDACVGLEPEPRLFNVDDLLVAEAPPAPIDVQVDADDICLLLYTSGTTGFPKGVMHSQRSFVMAGEGFVERMHLTPDDRLLCVLPLYHINALFYSLGGTVAAGASLVLAPRFSASGFWPLVESSGATEVNIIAALGSILARRPPPSAGHTLRKVYGAPITPEIYEVFERDFGIPVLIEGYGMTEVPGVANNPFDDPRSGSMGKAALHPSQPFAELRVVDGEGRDVADGEIGELWVKSPIAMKGYYRDRRATEAAFRDGWFMTGDLARRDADGFHYFVARQKDIIRRRGENISGAELDRVIGLCPAVVEAATIAVPSDLGEDEILAVVVREPDSNIEAGDIAAWCAQHLAANKVPRYVVFVAELPHTPTHRVAKFKLKQDESLLERAVDLERR